MIRISDRKAYVTNVILLRQTREGCTLAALKLSRVVVRLRHCYVKVTSSFHIASYHIQEIQGPFLNIKMRYFMVSKKKYPIMHVRMG